MKDIGHWSFPLEFDPEQFVGFVYRITHISTGRIYIGKKIFWSSIRKIVKNRKNRKKIIKESDWRKYTGSSKSLNEEINKFGKDQFKFEILSLHECKSTLAWEETRILVINDALRAKLPDGTKKFFNGLICGIKYEVKEETEIEKQFKIQT
jgi:predicted transcriptional regulator